MYNQLPEVGGKIQKLINSKDAFASLSFFEQLNVIIESLKLCNCKKFKAELKTIGLGSISIMRINKELPRPFRIIRQSPTGFYEKIVFPTKKELTEK